MEQNMGMPMQYANLRRAYMIFIRSGVSASTAGNIVPLMMYGHRGIINVILGVGGNHADENMSVK